MRTCDVAVVGLGLMGSAILDALLNAGVDALGFDPLGHGSNRGSSHGSCRVFRRFNFENENYTDLSDAALAGWTRLEADSGETILIRSPVLEAGRPGSAMVAASRAAAIAKGRPDPVWPAAAANREFPAFALPPDWDVVVQEGGAILKADVALRIMRLRAGDRVFPETGFPDFEQRGIKAAPHNHGPEVSANDWDPPATDAELLPVSEALAELVPGAAGPVVERDICLYTNTLPADRRLDKGEEFIIDRWPNSRLIVASPCSGHGAKFAPAIGEKLARLAVDPAYEVEPFFQLSRYSAFA